MSETPIGGGLFIDLFCAHRRAVAARNQASARPVAAQKQASAPPEARPSIPLAAPGPDPLSDTGRMRAEVAAFMNRDVPDGTDDTEIQEFLKERSGFDPTGV